MAVRASSRRLLAALPSITTSPLSAFSSRPAMCSSVDLPQPDGPTSATISPGCTDSDTPFSTSSLASALPKPRAMFCRARTSALPLLISKRLHRIEPRRPPRGIETRQQGEAQRYADNHRDLPWPHDRRQMRKKPRYSFGSAALQVAVQEAPHHLNLGGGCHADHGADRGAAEPHEH